jgi:hypothetical protein
MDAKLSISNVNNHLAHLEKEDVGGSIVISPIAGWFIRENPSISKWMIWVVLLF